MCTGQLRFSSCRWRVVFLISRYSCRTALRLWIIDFPPLPAPSWPALGPPFLRLSNGLSSTASASSNPFFLPLLFPRFLTPLARHATESSEKTLLATLTLRCFSRPHSHSRVLVILLCCGGRLDGRTIVVTCVCERRCHS
jgi:hypothetical protein